MVNQLYPVAWKFLWPVRFYIRFCPVARGKRYLVRYLIDPALPPPTETFFHELPGGGEIEFYYRESLGKWSLLLGLFERAELEYIRATVRPGDRAIDAGAHAGLFTIVLARAVGPRGHVIAFEPVPANLTRLYTNISRNQLDNVTVHSCALWEVDGAIDLELTADAAYASAVTLRGSRPTGEVLRVRAKTLDDVWRDEGSPDIAAMKIDTEGAELSVLRGAKELLRSCHPRLLVEASSPDEVAGLLSRYGYKAVQPTGFKPWNYAFE